LAWWRRCVPSSSRPPKTSPRSSATCRRPETATLRRTLTRSESPLRLAPSTVVCKRSIGSHDLRVAVPMCCFDVPCTRLGGSAANPSLSDHGSLPQRLRPHRPLPSQPHQQPPLAQTSVPSAARSLNPRRTRDGHISTAAGVTSEVDLMLDFIEEDMAPNSLARSLGPSSPTCRDPATRRNGSQRGRGIAARSY
jgi:hypothetical protein